jgi:hypothetical protein
LREFGPLFSVSFAQRSAVKMRWNHWGAHWRGRSSFDRASVTVFGVLDEELGPVAVKTGN